MCVNMKWDDVTIENLVTKVMNRHIKVLSTGRNPIIMCYIDSSCVVNAKDQRTVELQTHFCTNVTNKLNLLAARCVGKV